jgi:multicomponent Na+:H+ antiporter subunit G
MEIIGAVIVLIGSLVLLIASLGLVRMPDVYNRLQVGTKSSTLGTILTFFGMVFIMPEWWGKLILLVVFVMVTNPVSSHVLARAAYFIKIPFTKQTVVDKLKVSEKAKIIKVEPKNYN